MSDRTAQWISGVLLVAAALVLATGVSGSPRVLIFVAFSGLSPGLAATRFLPRLDWPDRLALSVAISLAMVILVSMMLVALERWNGTRAFVELAFITGALVIMPHWRKPGRRLAAQVRPAAPPAEQMAALRARTRSADPYERRAGLLELAAVLEGQGELEWAGSLRSQASQIGMHSR